MTTQKKKLAEFAANVLENPRDVRGTRGAGSLHRPRLFGLSFNDWKHLTGTFTFGSGATKTELDEITRQSMALWK